MGRVGAASSWRLSATGRLTLPCRRATLNSKSPPYSMICRVMSSLPAVNSSRRISSPASMRGMMEKSSVARTPRF